MDLKEIAREVLIALIVMAIVARVAPVNKIING